MLVAVFPLPPERRGQQAPAPRLPALRLPLRHILKRLGLALMLAVPALVLWVFVASSQTAVQAFVVLPAYAGCYLGWAWWKRTPELDLWLGRFRRR